MTGPQGALFETTLVGVAEVNDALARGHYLGPTASALFAWDDGHGCMVFGRPRSRRLPDDWLELVRWCLTPDGVGSMQFAAFARWARRERRETTIVSYSDPAAGHDGALYRACGWLWAPTWLRLRPPPSGNGAWSGGSRQSPKDRWVYPLRRDARRAAVLHVNDETLARRMAWASYREPAWHGRRFDPSTGGGDYRRWRSGGCPPDRPPRGASRDKVPCPAAGDKPATRR